MYWLIQTGSFDVSALLNVLTISRILLLLTLTFGLIAVNSYRWKRILMGLNRDVPYKKILPLSLIAVFFNLVMPGGVGGDVIKGYYFVKEHPGSRGDSILSIFIDRFIGLYVLILMASVALLIRFSDLKASEGLKSLSLGTFTFLFAFTFFFSLSFSKRLQNLPGLKNIFYRFPQLTKMNSFNQLGKTMSVAFLLSALSQSFQVLFIMFIGEWLQAGLSHADYFYIVPLGILASSLPLTPAGIGVGQAAFYFLVNFALGTESALGPLSISAFQLSQVFWAIPGACFYLLRKN